MYRTFYRLFFLILFTSCLSVYGLTPSKYEFRGAWVHTVGQSKYAKMNEETMKAYFIRLLDSLQLTGINAVLFQVRPEADAWYPSDLEPWSRYITGEQGKNPGWDPMAFLIEECHKRGMDFHAWLNPYRVRNSPDNTLYKDHLYYSKKWQFIEYGDYIWFDPGIPSNRLHIEKVVKDIVKRYDIDAIHMDDYFYPYPIAGKPFDDSWSFSVYGKAYTQATKGDWRRNNVDLLIKELHRGIHETKPWVQFGVSPFGIYRNEGAGHKGSATKGFTNYDGLYADILHWIDNGWIDYVIPQLYWEIGHKSADYTTLLHWWSENNGRIPLYIGQDVFRTMRPDSLKKRQLTQKMKQAENQPQVSGYCFWPAYELTSNTGNIVDSLRTHYFPYPALTPIINTGVKHPAPPVFNLRLFTFNGTTTLSWSAPRTENEGNKARYYVVYGYTPADSSTEMDPSHIISISSETFFRLPSTHRYTSFAVTAINRYHSESKAVSISSTTNHID